MTEHDLAVVQEMQAIIAKTSKLAARHDHLRALLLTQLRQLRTPDETILVLAEADRCMEQILRCMDEMADLCEKETVS